MTDKPPDCPQHSDNPYHHDRCEHCDSIRRWWIDTTFEAYIAPLFVDLDPVLG